MSLWQYGGSRQKNRHVSVHFLQIAKMVLRITRFIGNNLIFKGETVFDEKIPNSLFLKEFLA
jgi:hypothetical protein